LWLWILGPVIGGVAAAFVFNFLNPNDK
jgi:hypothetical protein